MELFFANVFFSSPTHHQRRFHMCELAGASVTLVAVVAAPFPAFVVMVYPVVLVAAEVVFLGATSRQHNMATRVLLKRAPLMQYMKKLRTPLK